MPSKSFGQIVRDLRIKHRDYSSLRDFARKVGLSPAYLSRIENGKEPPPSESIIEKIAEALGADKYEFFSCAGRVPTEFLETFKKNPKGVASFMRKAHESGLETDHEWKELEDRIARVRKGREGQK